MGTHDCGAAKLVPFPEGLGKRLQNIQMSHYMTTNHHLWFHVSDPFHSALSD